MELATTTTTSTTTSTPITTVPKDVDSPPLNETTPLLLVIGSDNNDHDDDDDDDNDSKNKDIQEEDHGLATTPLLHKTLRLFASSSSSLSGTLRVALGAAFFAATNAAATALYRRNGVSVVSLYMIRSPIIYLANAALVSLMNFYAKTIRGGEQPQPCEETAMDVLFLRTPHRQASHLAFLRSFLNSIKQVLLSVGFVFMTYADAFVIFKGVAVCGAILVARLIVGDQERLRPQELVCGIFVVLGILCIAPPSFLDDGSSTTPSTEIEQSTTTAQHDDDHDDDVHKNYNNHNHNNWVPRQTAGVILVVMAGLLSAFSGTLMRILSASAGPHKATPSMLLSYLMVLFFLVNTFVMIVIGPLVNHNDNDDDGDSSAQNTAWAWTTFVWPHEQKDWILIGLNCVCTLGGHLATAAGYQTTRAGIVAFLQLTEIPWVYLLDVLVLGESTSVLKTWGSMIVFGSAVAAAVVAHRGGR